MVYWSRPHQGRSSTSVILVGVDGLQLQLVVVDPEVRGWGIEFLSECSILALEIGLVVSVWIRNLCCHL